MKVEHLEFVQPRRNRLHRRPSSRHEVQNRDQPH